jgi:hypothetical protein
MKTFWKTITPNRAREIAKEHAENFGVEFACTHFAGGIGIRPCIGKNTIASNDGLADVLDALTHAKSAWGIMSFLEIADVSGLSLKKVIAVAKFINTGANRTGEITKVSCDIDRSGKIVAMHIRK